MDEQNEYNDQPAARPGKKNTLKDYFTMGEVGRYFFRKKDPSRPENVNIRMMHGINKLSIAVFIAAVIYLILKRFI